MREWIDLINENERSAADKFRADAHSVKLPAEVQLGHVDENTVELVSLYTPERGKGNGTATMKILCDLADKHGVTIELFPRSAVEYGWDDESEDFSDALDQSDLEDWYYRMGFTYPDESDQNLVRYPKVT